MVDRFDGGLNRVIEQRRRGHIGPGARAAEEQVRDVAAVQADAVQRAGQRSQRLGRGEKHGPDECANAGRIALSRDHRFESASCRSSRSEIIGGQVANASHLEGFPRQSSPPEQRRQQQQLVGGITAIQIA